MTDFEPASATAMGESADAQAALESLRASQRAYIDAVERFVKGSWQAADALLAAHSEEQNLTLFAIQRAYYALYNTAVAAAELLDLPLDRYQQGSHHHQENEAIPHAQLPVLVADLMKLVDFTEVASGNLTKGEQAFETARVLQKYRLRADYMGCEKVSAEGATECINWARTLVDTIWTYTRKQHDDGNSR